MISIKMREMRGFMRSHGKGTVSARTQLHIAQKQKCYGFNHTDSFVTPCTVAHQSSLSMRFYRHKCWSGLPFPSPGDLPDPGIQPVSRLLAREFFTTEPPGKPTQE